MNTTQRGFTFDINNSSYLTTIDINKGGSITKIKNNNGSNTDINGSNPMFYSPYVAAGLTVYGPQNLANPLFSVDTNGPLTSIITVKGTVGGMDYNTRYTTYAKNSFFWYDENISSNQSGTSWDISDNFASFLPNKFNKFTNLFSNTLSTSDVNMLNNTLLINDVNFIGVYNKRSLDRVGAVFFTKQSSKSLSPTTTFYDQSVYAYWKRNIYSGIISSGDYFNSHGAVVVFNSWNGSGDLNDLFVQLSNPLSLVAGSEVVVDSNAPSLTTQGRVPSVVSDSVDLNCYATWHDDLLLDYVLVNVVGPDLNITNARLSARVKDYNAVYSVSASLLNAGDVNCVFTAYNVAAKTATATESVTVTDNTVPFVSGVTITPDSNVGVDPGADVIVDANVTEYTALRDVNLLVRIYDSNAGWGAWSSNAMTNDYSYGYTYHYTGDFNTTALVDSLWQYKIYSSDTLDHNSDSNVMSVYSYWDWTWSVTPTFFGVQSILFGEEATLGDLNVTNTGDKILRFMVSSDWDNKTQITYGGEAETSIGYRFYLNPKNSFGNSVLLPVKVGAKTVQSDTNFGIYVNALDSSASPTQTTTLARVVSYAGGPYLLIDWVDSNTSVTKGDTGLLYTVRVTNKGNEIATNPITIDWNYPTGWTLTSGALSTILDTNLAVDSYVSDSIGLTVSDSAVLGAQNITFTAGCCGDVNKTQTSTLAVTVNAAGTVVVTPTEEQGGAAGAGPGGGAGTG
ncbi:MAG: hypothetical protein NTY48_07175, partial [Candidatus Diapherotrites archaeon]|nr:hypothetical protein [Candidatus Diapherotrites archaeon]